jgi:hypothetical protein
MTITFGSVLLLLAVICFLASAFGVTSTRVNLQSAGLACLALAMLVAAVGVAR